MTICVDANSSQMMNERKDPSMKRKLPITVHRQKVRNFVSQARLLRFVHQEQISEKNDAVGIMRPGHYQSPSPASVLLVVHYKDLPGQYVAIYRCVLPRVVYKYSGLLSKHSSVPLIERMCRSRNSISSNAAQSHVLNPVEHFRLSLFTCNGFRIPDVSTE